MIEIGDNLAGLLFGVIICTFFVALYWLSTRRLETTNYGKWKRHHSTRVRGAQLGSISSPPRMDKWRNQRRELSRNCRGHLYFLRDCSKDYYQKPLVCPPPIRHLWKRTEKK